MGAMVLLLGRTGHMPRIDTTTLMRFDALHYAGIMRDGYASNSSAFFPLFPFIWKCTSLGPIGISILNGTLFMAATAWMIRILRPPLHAVLLFAALPAMLFFFVPYSEATFFLGATGMIWAARERKPWMIALAMVWCTLARPSFTVLLPALLIMVGLGEGTITRKAGHMLLYTGACALALLAVILAQHAATGNYFGFYAAQAEFGNTFKMPKLPLTSWGGDAVVRLDSVALLAGATAGVLLLRAIGRRTLSHLPAPPPEVVLSMAYVAGMALLALLLRNGSLYSLNRFVFATPFALVLIAHYIRKPIPINGRRAAIMFLVLSLYFLLFASFVHIRTFLTYSALAGFLILIVYALGRPGAQALRHPALWAALIGVMVFQLYFIHRFLSGLWVA